jgi:hypothetical protein
MPNVFYIPAGPKNLSALFPSINWDNVKSYNIEVTDGSSTIATSPVIKVSCCPDDFIRLHFVNSLGGVDAVSFLKPKVIHEDTASEYQNALGYPLQKTDTGIERFNVKGNDTYEAKYKCNEGDMNWLRELADSPKIFLEWIGTESQADDYIPVVKIAGKFEKVKNIDEFQYEFIIQFKLSNDYIMQRN